MCENLIVVVARDSRVLSGKGFLPNDNEEKRQQNVADFLEKNFKKYSHLFLQIEKISEKNFSKKYFYTKNVQKILKKIKNCKRLISVNMDFAILGDEKNIFAPIENFCPEILCFGYDQRVPEDILHDKFPNILTKRIASFSPEKYKSSILRKKI